MGQVEGKIINIRMKRKINLNLLAIYDIFYFKLSLKMNSKLDE